MLPFLGALLLAARAVMSLCKYSLNNVDFFVEPGSMLSAITSRISIDMFMKVLSFGRITDVFTHCRQFLSEIGWIPGRTTLPGLWKEIS